MKNFFFLLSCVLLILVCLAGSKGTAGSSSQYCNDRFDYCLDYPASMFQKTYFSEQTDSLLFTTLDSLGKVSVISTTTDHKLDSHQVFEERMRQLAATGCVANILSITNGDDYYEVNFLCGNHWYHQKAAFYRNFDVLFTLQVPVNRPELMMRLKQDVKIEFQ